MQKIRQKIIKKSVLAIRHGIELLGESFPGNSVATQLINKGNCYFTDKGN